jgi:hypothetical protein
MSYQDKFKEELGDRIRQAEVAVESTQYVCTIQEVADLINDPIKLPAEHRFTFNLGVLKGLKEAKKLIEEIENELQK